MHPRKQSVRRTRSTLRTAEQNQTFSAKAQKLLPLRIPRLLTARRQSARRECYSTARLQRQGRGKRNGGSAAVYADVHRVCTGFDAVSRSALGANAGERRGEDYRGNDRSRRGGRGRGHFRRIQADDERQPQRAVERL